MTALLEPLRLEQIPLVAVAETARRPLWIANARNGLPFVPDPDGISLFLSTHGHSAQGYFRLDAMPHHATVELLRAGRVIIVDASATKPLPDSLVTGVGTWALAFGRAARLPAEVPWATRAMWRAANSTRHRKVVRTIRRLASVYGFPAAPLRVVALGDVRYRWAGVRIEGVAELPALGPVIGIWSPARAAWDDRPEVIARMLARERMKEVDRVC